MHVHVHIYVQLQILPWREYTLYHSSSKGSTSPKARGNDPHTHSRRQDYITNVPLKKSSLTHAQRVEITLNASASILCAFPIATSTVRCDHNLSAKYYLPVSKAKGSVYVYTGLYDITYISCL